MAAIDAIRNCPQRVTVTYKGILIDSLHIRKAICPIFADDHSAADDHCRYRHNYSGPATPSPVSNEAFYSFCLRLYFLCFTLFINERLSMAGSWRQFLFVYPGLVVFATIGIIYP